MTFSGCSYAREASVLAWLVHAANWMQSYAAAVQAVSAVVVTGLTFFLVKFTLRYVKGTEAALKVSRDQLQVLREQVEDQRQALAFSRAQHERGVLENHREDLNLKVLEPLQRALESDYGQPIVQLDWSAQRYNPNASAHENPITVGPILRMSEPERGVSDSLDAALFEDAKHNHHRDLVPEWETFTVSWQEYRDQLRMWIEEMAQRILTDSQLPAHPSHTNRYVMNLNLALFVYNRLMRGGELALRIDDGTSLGLGSPVVTDGGTNYAAGTAGEMQHLMAVVEDLLASQRQRASAFARQWSNIEKVRAALSHKFSYAIADKTPPEKCPLVGLN
jgi:hypothetical protein